MNTFKVVASAVGKALLEEFWFAVRMVYYGLLLGIGALSGASLLVSLLP